MGGSRPWYRLFAVKPPWGDYGSILLSGMTARLGRTREGLLQLERTGPFVPPITVAGLGDLLVTDAFRAELERSPLAGFEFRAVEKTHIVRLDWENWDQTAADPQEYPEGGEPEGYILDRPHDPQLAALIGAIWEMVLPAMHDQADADLVTESRHVYATQRAKGWLEQHASAWLSFAD